MQQQSPLASTLTQSAILEHTSLPAALAALLAAKLGSCAEECEAMRSTVAAALGTAPLLRAVLCDLAKAVAAAREDAGGEHTNTRVARTCAQGG